MWFDLVPSTPSYALDGEPPVVPPTTYRLSPKHGANPPARYIPWLESRNSQQVQCPR